VLQQQIDGDLSREEKINRIREYLQIMALKIMFDHDFFQSLAFVGGTALRILFDLKRYSEYIDFSLIQKRGFHLEKLIRALAYELDKNGLTTEIKMQKDNVVYGGFIKFPGLLYDLGLSPLPSQKLAIKLEIDAKPPRGGNVLVTPVTKSYVFAVRHFDLPSLYATKLHACFFRKYVKGRDFYDLVWYLGKKVDPNMALLNNAVRQTQKKDFGFTKENYKKMMMERLKTIDFRHVRSDVERFLEDRREIKLLDKEMILQMLG
ncbi:nucleotidyl transferase AbiEii/AbiGii toxin family protein, partial [candidate division FCPU426 bacterium]|nr:nucleotidyl transferase AbiEii/AbiGii toxin family protein [candidate division FCPU426 bacterium]